MAYSIVSEVRAAVASIPGDSRNKTPAQLSDGQIEYAILSADAQIDSHLRRRYDLPFVSVPSQVKALSIAIAAYECANMFMNVGPLNEESGLARMYDRAFKILDGIRTGKFGLDSDEVSALEGDLGSFVFNDYDGSLFGTDHIFGHGEHYIPPDRTYY